MAIDLLASLDPEQREVVSTLDRPVCVIAGAGTGKTRAITHRIAYAISQGSADADRSLALTFTARAARELRERLGGLGIPDVQARTFHSAALRQLQYFWPRVERGPMPRLVPSKNALALAAARINALDEDVLGDLVTEIEWAKVSLIAPEEFGEAAQSRPMPAGLGAERVADFYRTYESLKAQDGAIDFEDVLLVVAGLIAENTAVAEQVHDQYRHFTVDEYQDVSPLQHQLLDLWLGGREDICVVGDPNQTIYSFAGANPDYLLAFAESSNAHTVRLFRDYRSTPQIVEFANRLVTKEARLVGQRPAGPAPEIVGMASDETKVVAERVAALLEGGTAPAEVAVLVRTNGQAEQFARALAARNIPTTVRRTEGEDPTPSAVTVASLHAAKGLEWEYVFLCGAIEGLLPISYATSEEAIAEEKRLFYVGVTRARHQLTITYQGQPSRFLNGPATTVATAPIKTAASVTKCRVCNQTLVTASTIKRGRCDRCPADIDHDLLARLVQWRDHRAKTDAMPAFVVATEATLEALAELGPTTLEEVSTVIGRRKSDQYGEDLLRVITGS